MTNKKINILDLSFKNLPLGIASFLIEMDGGPVLVETGPHSTFEILKSRVDSLGYDIEDIQHVFLTHIHLDHGGAAWCMAEHGAKIYLHPFGFRHMHDPTKLLASATRIYGDEMDSLWGTLKAIPEGQLKIVKHLEGVPIGNNRFIAHHTPGHARHHIAWQLDNDLFTGDVAGVRINDGPVIPPCPPPDIDREAWLNSIDHCLSIPGVDTYFLTHFGMIKNVATHMGQLKNSINAYVDFVKPFAQKEIAPNEILPEFRKFVQAFLRSNGISEEELMAYEAANPADMSVYGLLRYWTKYFAKITES